MLCTSQVEASTSPPGHPPGNLNFWKFFVQIPTSPGRKAVQMPPPLEELPGYCFNFSVASIMLLRCCACKHGLLDNTDSHTIKINRSPTPSNTELSLCRPLVFNQSDTNTQSFPLNSSKFDVPAVSDLSRNMTSRLAIKFPSSRARKDVKWPGCARGGEGGGC